MGARTAPPRRHSRGRLITSLAFSVGDARLARAVKFGLVGVVGLAVNVGAQLAFTEGFGINYLLAAILATQVSSTMNFVLADHWVFDGTSSRIGRARRFAAFLLVNNATLAIRGPMIWFLTSRVGIHYAVSNLISLASLTLLRFGIADSLIWREPRTARSPVTVTTTWPRRLRTSIVPIRRTVVRSWTTIAAMEAILAAAIFLRLAHLSAVGFNSDEAVYAGQGAAMFGVGDAADHFSLFRAHPLLLQAFVGMTFRVVGESDVAARAMVAIVFGVGSVILTYVLGHLLGGRLVGLIAAATCAVLPYHVIVSRQVLVDTAMGFFATLALCLIVRWVQKPSNATMIGAFAAAGAAALSKEIAVFLVPVLLYAVWQRYRWHAAREPVVRWSLAIYVALVIAFPLTRLVNNSKSGSAFFLWQFSRAPNHGWDWFLRVLYQYATPAIVILALAGAGALVVRRLPSDRVVLSQVALFLGFFTVWPTKLFPYLYLLIPALSVLAAFGIVLVASEFRRLAGSRLIAHTITAVAVSALLVVLCVLSWRAVNTTVDTDVPGAGDYDVEVQSFAGTREFAEWARSTPVNARFLTIGPSLGNILRFYGDRDSVAMSVSVDPAKRNPAYVPVPNPDLALRQLEVQYVVWDSYSADRSSFYSARTLAYARKFDGAIVFSAFDEDGELRVALGPPPTDASPRLLVYSIDGGPLPATEDAE